MLFSTSNFAIFFLVVFTIYWCCKRFFLLQNSILLIASFIFYTWADINYIYYLGTLIIIGYISAKIIAGIQKKYLKKICLILCVVSSASLLFIGKYNSFILHIISNSIDALVGKKDFIHLIIPIGLSYYTLSTIGYIVDVYRHKTQTQHNLITYAAYISFFPHILSGPIPSSKDILHQFLNKRNIGRIAIEDAIGQIIWGLFKKLIIAEHVRIAVSYCFTNQDILSGSTLFVGITLFSIQIYADFSGYSDMARGLAQLLGFKLTQNFKFPFLSRDPGEYWRRWHTSLRKWLIDYIYIPLGGSSGPKWRYIIVLLFTFTFSGLWHGNDWTFLCWGFLNGLFCVPYILTNKLHRYKDVVSRGKFFPSIKELLQLVVTFNLISLSRVFFRSNTLDNALLYYNKVFSHSFFIAPAFFITKHLLWGIPLIVIEWLQRAYMHGLDLRRFSYWIKYAVFIIVILSILLLHKTQGTAEYYYFRF